MFRHDDIGDGELLERFVARRDQAAFEALVRRHGAMVLGVCRRILRDAHEADDAFQATFLVLVRKAAGLRRPEQLGPWLYGVAYRTALHARASRRRLPILERQVRDMAGPEPTPDTVWRELRLVLDEEIAHLPERYRAPFVLCYLEGKTYEEIGRSLGWPKGTVSTRLTRARDLLRQRLSRRGIAVPAALFTGIIARDASGAVPTALVVDTVHGAALVAAGNGVATLPAPILALTEGVCQTMVVTKLQTVTTLLLIVALTAGAGTLAYCTAAADRALDEKSPVSIKGPAALAGDDTGPARPGTRDKIAPAGSGAGEDVRAPRATKPTGSVAFSPDGRLFASGDAGNVIRLWDAASGNEVRSLAGHSDAILALAFSPDGRLLASTGRDKKVLLWDVRSGKERARLRGGDSIASAVAFSPDGRSVATAGLDDKTVRIWDVTKADEQGPGAVHEDAVLCVAYSPDGRTIASGGADKTVHLWEAGRKDRVLAGHEEAVTGVAFSPDGKLVASAGADGAVRFWDVASGKEVRRLNAGGKRVASLAFAPDGRTLATASDKAVRLWDFASGRVVAEFRGHDRAVTSIAYSPDGKLLVSASGDGALRVWDAASGRLLRSLGGARSDE
jgi:RNA polymerase sigma factor (sigma-70 family)